MYNTPRNNIKRTPPIPSRRPEFFIDTRLEIRDITGEHAAQDMIRANIQEHLRIKRRMEQIPFLDRLVVLVFDGELVDDEFVETVYDGHLGARDHRTVVSCHEGPGVCVYGVDG